MSEYSLAPNGFQSLAGTMLTSKFLWLSPGSGLLKYKRRDSLLSGTVWWSKEGWIPTFMHFTTRVWEHKHRKSTDIFWNRNNTSVRMLWHPRMVIYIKHISGLYPNDTLSYRMIYDESPMQAILYQFQTDMPLYERPTQKAKFMRPTWGPPGSCRPQMGPMLAPWTLLLG